MINGGIMLNSRYYGSLVLKGNIAFSSDFPTLSQIELGDFYIIISDVTDNDATKTNTGQSFTAGEKIFWDGTDWSVLSETDGTVSTVSVVSANGFAGTVSNPSTTPAITLSTTISGILKGNATAISAAASGTDYVAPSSYASVNGLTMATNRILGRITAGTGNAEEISISNGLDLSSGSLSFSGTSQLGYNNGDGKITTNPTNGAAAFQQGSGLDTDDVLEVLNGAGTQVAKITGEGEIYSNRILAGTNDPADANNGYFGNINSTTQQRIVIQSGVGFPAVVTFQEGVNAKWSVFRASNNNFSIYNSVTLSAAMTIDNTTNKATFIGDINVEGLTASQAVQTDASKNLISLANTGTGNNVLDDSPTLITPEIGSGTATTQTQGDNSTKVATTAYVDTGLSGKEDSLGFTPEDITNKAIDFSTVNDTLYPSTKAVNDSYVPFTGATKAVNINTQSFTAGLITAANNCVTFQNFLISGTGSFVSLGTGGVSTPSGTISGLNVTATRALILPTGTTAQRPTPPENGMLRINTDLGFPEWYDSANSKWLPVSGYYTIEYLVVAGGGGGGSRFGGGGGAGGYITGSLLVHIGETFDIVIGAGGAGGVITGGGGTGGAGQGSDGSQSSFGDIIADGGGGGGKGDASNGTSGSSGGGGAGRFASFGGSGTVGQGNDGGSCSGSAPYVGGGGGGAGAVGATGSNGTGNGGAGTTWSDGVNYAGGGGGGADQTNTPGTGGAGGGGAGGKTGVAATAGTANKGGGGGGGAYLAGGTPNQLGGNGGSGVVIIRYLGIQIGSGGTVTSSGGYTYHTFTTSATLTA